MQYYEDSGRGLAFDAPFHIQENRKLACCRQADTKGGDDADWCPLHSLIVSR